MAATSSYQSQKITAMYALRAKTVEKLAGKVAGWRSVTAQLPYLAKIPLARYCWLEVSGEYSNPYKLTNALKSCRFMRDVLAEGGSIYMSENIGENPKYEELLAELYLLSIASRDDNFWMRVVLYDEAQYGNFPLKIVKFLVRKGALIIKDVRREGVEEQSTRLQQQLDEINKKTKLLEMISKQIDADEHGDEVDHAVKEFPPGDEEVDNGRRKLTLDETNSVLESLEQ